MRRGLRDSSVELLHKLYRHSPIFTFQEAIEISGYDKSYLKLVLHKLERAGWIERIERGKYIILPLEAEKGKYTLHEFVVGSYLVKPSVIAYWSALHFHGLTEQIPGVVFIQTISRKRRRKLVIFNTRYRIVRITERKFFGFEKRWINHSKITITDKEKTILDCLDKPQYCGGVREVFKGLKEGGVNLEKLSNYLQRFKSGAVAKRLLYLMRLLGLEIEVPETLIKKGIVALDPTMPRKGRVDYNLRLLINLELEE